MACKVNNVNYLLQYRSCPKIVILVILDKSFVSRKYVVHNNDRRYGSVILHGTPSTFIVFYFVQATLNVYNNNYVPQRYGIWINHYHTHVDYLHSAQVAPFQPFKQAHVKDVPSVLGEQVPPFIHALSQIPAETRPIEYNNIQILIKIQDA